VPKKPLKKDDTDLAALSFENAMSRVEEIIAKIESGEIGLEGSIDEYERGVALVARCREILARAEQRVEDLTDRMRQGQEPTD
jgi:exodeoxyribonuclease VII small subunit